MNETTITKNEARQLNIVRDFEAPVAQVWRAWTEPSLLDQWWAPQPWKARTKSMEFREGGTWLYAMQGPAGEESWCRADFETIDPERSYTGTDAFCDEEGTVTNDPPGMHWQVVFTPITTGTRVNVVITFQSEEDLDKIVAMGFKEGFTAAHANLDKLLAAGVPVQ
jgi:uncharacterized protein YndB with AHSA1/START domain